MIYLASPYSDPSPEIRQARYEAARNLALHLTLSCNILVFSPILYCHNAALELNLRTTADAYERMNKHFQRLSSDLWILNTKGWDTSLGVRFEYEFAASIGQPCLFVNGLGSTVTPKETPAWLK